MVVFLGNGIRTESDKNIYDVVLKSKDSDEETCNLQNTVSKYFDP